MPSLSLPDLSLTPYSSFLSLGRLCQRSPRTGPVSLVFGGGGLGPTLSKADLLDGKEMLYVFPRALEHVTSFFPELPVCRHAADETRGRIQKKTERVQGAMACHTAGTQEGSVAWSRGADCVVVRTGVAS